MCSVSYGDGCVSLELRSVSLELRSVSLVLRNVRSVLRIVRLVLRNVRLSAEAAAYGSLGPVQLMLRSMDRLSHEPVVWLQTPA